jgi:hypothetical protein
VIGDNLFPDSLPAACSHFPNETMTYLTNMRLLEVIQRHLLMVQYTGDYREAVQHSTEGGGETYYAQKYSVDAVAEIGKNRGSSGYLLYESRTLQGGS